MHFLPKFLLLCLVFSAYAFLFSPPVFAGSKAEDSEKNYAKLKSKVNLIISCPVAKIDKIGIKQVITDKNAITISAKSSSIEKNELARFSGNVIMINQGQRISAEKLEFDRLKASFNAHGSIHYQAKTIDVFAQSLTANNDDQATTLKQSSYQLANNPAHGSAGELSISNRGDLTLRDSTFTTCQGKQPDWLLEASKIYISTGKNIGEAYNAKLKLWGVPVFYIPYFSFPVTNERKSGFLYPKIGSSNRSGIKIETPYYFNIAENVDATITPRYMSKRGLQLLTELRYLTDLQAGTINFEYLNKDQDLKNNNNARYLARIQHTGTFSDNFRVYADYTTISDDNYLVDIGSDYYTSNDAYLYQTGELSYFADNWQATVKLQDFEVLGDHVQSYRTVPQVEFSSFQALPFGLGSFDFYSELSRFETPDPTLPEANRYHVEAGFTLPITRPSWFLNSELKILQTNYQQKNISYNSKLSKNVSRTLPKLRFHGGFNLDRSIQYLGGNFTQTLEPQVQYLYIPEKDQSAIGIYDTTSLQDDYNGLFRDRRFSGLDRIARANQFSWGVTSRILNNTNQEVFRLSVGKILYLNNSNIATDKNNNIAASQSALAGDIFYQINNKWQLSGDIQYNTELGYTNKSEVNVNYQYNKKHLIQFNHRFARNVSGSNIEQVSLLASSEINKDWQFVGRLTQDLISQRSIESYAGLQYESCCWAVRFAFHRYINSKVDLQSFANETHNEFTSGFVIQFVIKGLGGEQSSVGVDDMFSSSIFGYKRPYFLNN